MQQLSAKVLSGKAIDFFQIAFGKAIAQAKIIYA
jgi:hypothetical protein